MATDAIILIIPALGIFVSIAISWVLLSSPSLAAMPFNAFGCPSSAACAMTSNVVGWLDSIALRSFLLNWPRLSAIASNATENPFFYGNYSNMSY